MLHLNLINVKLYGFLFSSSIGRCISSYILRPTIVYGDRFPLNIHVKTVSTYWAQWGWLWCFSLATFWSPRDTGTSRHPIPGRFPSSTWQDRRCTGRRLFHPAAARLTNASPGRKISLESRSCNMTQVSVAISFVCQSKLQRCLSSCTSGPCSFPAKLPKGT